MKKNSLTFLQSVKTLLATVLMVGSFTNVLGQVNLIFHSSTQTNKCLRCIGSYSGGGNSYVGGDSGTILLEAYNNFWTKQQSGTTNDLLGIVCAGPRVVAVGKTGTIILNGGTPWRSATSNTLETLRALASGVGLLVAVGDSGLIVTSPNDSMWTTRVSGTTKCLRSVAYLGGGGFTAVGDSGTILTSSDGIAWGKQTSGMTRNLNAVAIGDLSGGGSISGYKTVAVGDSGTVITSSDGVIWNSQTSGTTNALWGICCAWDQINGNWLFYVAVGENGTILTSSTDVTYPTFSLPGVKWSSQISGTMRNLYGVSWGYLDSMIVVGDSGTILASYFKPTTEIRQLKTPAKQQLISISKNIVCYTLSEPSLLSITLYDLKGRLVKTVINRIQRAGSYSVAMPHDISPGIYVANIIAGKQRLDRTIVVSRQ
jgi:hypothetical protein